MHAKSILFGPLNALFTMLFGDVSKAPAWWRDGITVAGFHIAGVAPRGEDGALIGWVPEHICMAFLVFAVCAVVFPILSRGWRKDTPGAAQNVVEVFVDFLRGVVKENIPHHPEKYLPIVGGFFFFIAISNMFGWFFFLQVPTANLNVTFALSISCFVFFNAAGIRAHGFLGYMKMFLGPVLLMAPLLFVIEMIGNFARALSLAMRLFGNIFGEHMAKEIFAGLTPIIVPWPIQALSLLVAFLQAYVFALLTAVYLGGATSHEAH